MIEHEVAWSAAVPSGATRPLASLYAIGGLACLLGVIWPVDPAADTGLLAVVGSLTLATGLVLFLPNLTIPLWLIHSLIFTGFLVVGVLVHASVSLAGAILTAFALPFTGLYASYFLTRRAARSQVLYGVLVFSIAWFARDGATPPAAWLVICGSLVLTAEIHGKLVTRLHHAAVADDLTGLLNRAGLRPSLDREIARTTRSGRPLTIAVIDVDGLKQVNDILGHASGDRLLTDLAAAWTKVLRGQDLLARVGGDEFVLVMPDTDVAGAHDIVHRLRGVDGPARGTRWSAGIATLRDGESADNLLDRADRRMYTAKRAGRDVQSGV